MQAESWYFGIKSTLCWITWCPLWNKIFSTLRETLKQYTFGTTFRLWGLLLSPASHMPHLSSEHSACSASDMKSLAMSHLPSGLSLLQPYKLQGHVESNTWTYSNTMLLSHKEEQDSEAGKRVGNQCSKRLPWVVYFRKLMFVRKPSFWRLPPSIRIQKWSFWALGGV